MLTDFSCYLDYATDLLHLNMARKVFLSDTERSEIASKLERRSSIVRDKIFNPDAIIFTIIN